MNSFTFPTVLAGPIVRRVELTQIVIWIATSRRFQIHAELHKMKSDGSGALLFSRCEISTIRMGSNLFIHLLKLSPDQGHFPTNQLLGYNLIFNHDTYTFDLEDLGMLSSETPQSIAYGPLKYPTFYIQNSNEPSRLFYGSCRKLHGDGEDTLVQADHLINQHQTNVEKRPHSLFLMGDQIYADDVADPMIKVISTLGTHLIGKNEKLETIENRLAKHPYKSSIQQINGRQSIMENLSQFTSSTANNHLIELGEYASMYLLSWSPALWEVAKAKRLFLTFDEAIESNQIYFEKSRSETLDKKKLQNRYTKQLHQLTFFQQSIYRIRRLLANIPTYMIFDDHEITDDWNITAKWKQSVRDSPLGKHVVANGLSAYWAFQGWGNQPDHFDQPFILTMKRYFKFLRLGNMMKAHQNWTEQLWNFNKWHFIAPTTPRAVFLDTRTQRSYPDKTSSSKLNSLTRETTPAPQLVNKTEWIDVTRQLFQSNWKCQSPLIVVSPVPFYGIGLIESFLQNYVYPLKGLGLNVHTRFDLEAWRYNGKGFTDFLHQVSNWNPRTCIILSGDAHFASSVFSRVTFQDGRELNLKQFTSSPLKNKSFTGMWGQLLKVVVEANYLFQKDKVIQHYCDPSYQIEHIENQEVLAIKSYLWKDQLSYQSPNDESIMETNNNLGLLSITSQSADSTLIQ